MAHLITGPRLLSTEFFGIDAPRNDVGVCLLTDFFDLNPTPACPTGLVEIAYRRGHTKKYQYCGSRFPTIAMVSCTSNKPQMVLVVSRVYILYRT